MRKVFLLLALVSCAAIANAQALRSGELETYAKSHYGEKWEDAAMNLASQLILDKNNALTYVQVIEAPEKTKEELYVLLNYWYSATFNDANAVIKLNDREAGSIIAEGYLYAIAWYRYGFYSVSVRPLIKCDIKDGRIRVTYTVPYYEVRGDAHILDGNWPINECFPFIDKKKDSHWKTSSKALVMVHAYSNVIMDKIQECVTNGLVGNESDDW